MGSARRNDWDEKTVMNDLPATQFAAEESGDRRTLRGIFDDDDLEATCVRQVPSSVMRAAADLESTLEISASDLVDLGQVALPPDPGAAAEAAPQSHLRRRAGVSPLIAALVIGTTLALATAAVVIASMAMRF